MASEAFVGLATAGLLSSTGDASNLTNLTGASAATYGNGTAVPQITVDSNGRITGISNVSISAGGGGGGSSMFIRDSGSVVGSAGTIDFGAGLSVSPVSAGIVTVTSSGISLSDLSVTTAGSPLQLGALAYNNSNGVFTFTPPDVQGQSRQAFSVGTANNPLQLGAISYASTSGVFTYTPPDLSSYLQVNGDGSQLTGIGTVAIGDNAPGSPSVGDLWWESDTATGHIYYNDGSTSQWVQFNSGSSGGSGSSGIGTSRFSVSNTTGSIGAGTTADITITGAKAYSLFKIETSHAAWVRLYTDTTSRTNDASRAYTTDPTPGSGVLAEVYTTTSGSNTFKMTPAVTGWNDDSTPSTNIYAKVTNNESTSQDITVTLTILRMED